MSGIQSVGAVSGAAPSDPGTAPASADLADAFAKGIVQFMGVLLQNSESDVQQACNDSTSDPDAPS